jgi:hypothetical protein
MQAGIDVSIFEKNIGSIQGASRFNQNRLHKGYHYPRNHETREQSLKGYSWFVDHYSHLLEPVKNNFYAVAKDSSVVDFQTYRQVMDAMELRYNIVPLSSAPIKLQGVSDLLCTDEMLIRNDLAGAYFDKILSGVLNSGVYLDIGNNLVLTRLKRDYDFVIDCTWGVARGISDLQIYYEPCIYFYYKRNVSDEFALTIMDGEFFSLYPYHDNVYTLTSVKHTPIGRCASTKEVEALLLKAKDKTFVLDKKRKFETEVQSIYPNFLSDFEFLNAVYSVKTKVPDKSDYRGCKVNVDENLVSVFSGKIDTLHIAEEELFKVII